MTMNCLALRPIGLGALSLVAIAWAGAVATGQAAEKPPALLEPYGGFDVVFGPTGPRVLAPEASTAVQAMLTAGGREFAGAALGCGLGDLRLEATRVLAEVVCGPQKEVVELAARSAASTEPGTLLFALHWPQAWATPCDATCTAQRDAVRQQLTGRVEKGEAAIPWQQVRPPPGSPAGAFLGALLDAHRALATRDDRALTAALETARKARPAAELTPEELFDFAVLARGAVADDSLKWALAALTQALAARAMPIEAGFKGPDAADLRAIAAAVPALSGDPTATVQKAENCANPPGCDVLPSVRALAAARAFGQAARLLDQGPLKAAKPRDDLLKLRFGLASASNDADAEQKVAQRMIELHPDSPEGYDVLAAGLARSGQFRKAIEVLHDLSKKHPERDIVLGRIAGLINFLTDEAGRDPVKKADLQAIEARMRAAATESNDVVARFIVATRAYYAGRLEEALPQLEALVTSGNRDPRIPLYTAMAHFWLGHQEQAQKLIQHAVDIGPSDPDVFYCRSQIVRSVNLPLAIADLVRYEAMTTQPWSVGPKQKAARVEAELAFMRRGELPPDWDRPGPERAPFQPDQQKGRPVSAEVREGKIWLPGAATPTDGPTAATAAEAVPAQAATATGDRGQGSPIQGPRSQDGDGFPWWPLTLLLSLVAAVAVRWWGRPKG